MDLSVLAGLEHREGVRRPFCFARAYNLTIFVAMNLKALSVTNFVQSLTEVIETGDLVQVDGNRGMVEVSKNMR